MLETPVSSREGTETFCLGTIPSLAFLLETPFTSRGDGNTVPVIWFLKGQSVRIPNHLARVRKHNSISSFCTPHILLEPPVYSRGYGNVFVGILFSNGTTCKTPQPPWKGAETYSRILYRLVSYCVRIPSNLERVRRPCRGRPSAECGLISLHLSWEITETYLRIGH